MRIVVKNVITRDIANKHIAFDVPCCQYEPQKDSVRHLLLPEDAEFFKNNFCK